MNKIYVTKPSLAPLSEFNEYLKQIWETGIMTHNGPLMQRLEKEVSAYEHVPDTICVANGTCAMQLAIRALDLRGEIITTPFTFIATANIIAWEHCKPVFVDINPETWNIDVAKIEGAITDKTVAILPVHVFSNPCDVEAIQGIADRHNLKVIYDAAHAMCVTKNGESIMSYGDVSCTSFHATKIFNTCEGGACFTPNKELADRIRRMRFFGFNEAKEIVDDGMNAKMTEMAAGLGLANLRHLDEVRRLRREKYNIYCNELSNCKYVSFQKIKPCEYNYSYMPILFDSENRLLCVLTRLNEFGVYPRRYFHPSLENLAIFGAGKLPVSQSIASRIACMPLYSDLHDDDIKSIAKEVMKA